MKPRKPKTADSGNKPRRSNLCEFKRSIYYLLKHHGKDTISSTRRSTKPLSERSRKSRKDFLQFVVKAIYDHGYKPRSTFALKPKHLDAVFDSLEKSGITYKTLQSKLSNLRFLVHFGGCPHLEDYIDKYAATARERYSDAPAVPNRLPESEEEIVEVLNRVFMEDSLVMLQLLLQWKLGLRKRESFRLRPRESYKGDTLHLYRGPKGGRYREVPIIGEEVHALLRHAMEVADAQGGSMMPAEFSEDQWRNHYNAVLLKCGVTKRGIGFTPHQLRHVFAQDLYEKVSGYKPPVLTDGYRTTPTGEAGELRARTIVAKALGHSRLDITSHYLDKIQQAGANRITTMRRPRGHGLKRKTREMAAQLREQAQRRGDPLSPYL